MKQDAETQPESNQNLEAILGMAFSYPDGLLIADKSDYVIFANLKAVEILHNNAEELVGHTIQEALEEVVLRAKEPRGLFNLLLNNQPEQPMQLGVELYTQNLERKNEVVEKIVQLTLFGVKDNDGKPAGRALILHDSTQEQSPEQVRNEFVAVVSHELRTPLSAIQGFSELLLTQEASPERQRLWLEMINRESVRLSGLIEDMLSLSHIHSGQIDIRLERVELEPVIRQCVEILRIGSSKHSFQLEITENLPPARTDRDKLIQILNNIIGNAIKYSNKGGTISIKVNYGSSNPETLEISISDEGVGISPDELPHIFEKFYRVRNSSTKQVKGIGLGLAITRNLVELLGGRIWVESTLGKGSTFYFSLPIHTFPHREVKAFKDILLKTLLVEDKDITEAELYLDYLQRTLPNAQLDEVLRDALYEIGNLWHKGEIGIGDEHLATGVIRDFLARAKTVSSPSNGLRMVLGSVAGEEHIVGLTMVANAFSRAGWTVTNLGANVPVSAFITTIEQSKPDILLLSISLSQRLIEIKRVVNEVREAFPDLMIGVGGRLLHELPDLSLRLGVDFRGTTPDETVRLATQMVQEQVQKRKPLIT